MAGLIPKYERVPAPSQASQAQAQTVVQRDDLCVTVAIETDVCRGRQVQGATPQSNLSGVLNNTSDSFYKSFSFNGLWNLILKY